MAGSWIIWEVCKAQGKLDEASNFLIKVKLDLRRLIDGGHIDSQDGQEAMREIDEKVREIMDIENKLDPILRKISEAVLSDG